MTPLSSNCIESQWALVRNWVAGWFQDVPLHFGRALGRTPIAWAIFKGISHCPVPLPVLVLASCAWSRFLPTSTITVTMHHVAIP